MLTEKNKHLQSTTSQRLNHVMVLHIHVNFAKDKDFKQAANNIVLKQSVKNDQFVQSLNWILRIYKYVMVLKKSGKTDQFVQSSNWILHIYRYVMVLKKSVKNDQFAQSSDWILCLYKYVCVGKISC